MLAGPEQRILNLNFTKNKHMTDDKIPSFEFHISKKARNKYIIDQTLFSIKGRVIFANIAAARKFILNINKERDAGNALNASEINAMGLLDEIMHYVIETYRAEKNPSLFKKMENFLSDELGGEALDKLLRAFAEAFPSTDVYNGKMNAGEYLEGTTGDLSNRHVILEEIMVLWLDNRNPAYQPIYDLIDEKELTDTIYDKSFILLNTFFKNEPSFGPENLPLLDLLLQPSKKFPHSITAQLEYIRKKWSVLIPSFLSRILLGMDLIKEEQKPRFDADLFGHGPTEVTQFTGTEYEQEPERFSQDLHWMPRLVLMAKSTYVWLDQLSKQYQRNIYRLDQVPDEELDRLSQSGFTGLWLIGLWERSKASRRIKQISGNPEAVASAYSLYNYSIANDLGGDEAYQNLKDRAWKRGIRLASDMVPNHMGIDSEWLINHPSWFVQSHQPPFPGYNFSGQDLSDDPRVGIFIEDGYWNKTDASVVFKRLDRYTGDVRYVYHGNDGTSMPWNDTAQLNYLMPEVREAVIQTILHVARKFPIIRFDAAMTLAKKHYQRLWFPEPGSGGDIPSRAEQGLTKANFDRLFPIEFWREVVDRVQQEVPDTLLLAEAFWMMEGYFVRSLGMHRVYNSAFMNMLKKEENQKYRESIRNVLEFNPQILKRYVNFMNNPDEETAIAQFGKDDKYFGVCVLMCTMPGLPMFGHGQIEGYKEKYGMEYRRAYWDEQPDEWLVKRHQKEIFPLMKKRYLFSDVEEFLLYDFFTSEGRVNENVFAYSNRSGSESCLVLYNNKFEHASGWVKTSVGFKNAEDNIVQKTLGEGLNLTHDNQKFVIFRDQITGLEYLRSSKDLSENGLFVELGAFKYNVFLDFHEVTNTAQEPWAELNHYLRGRPVESVREALTEYRFGPVIQAFDEAINPGSLLWLSQGLNDQKMDKKVYKSYLEKTKQLLSSARPFINPDLAVKSDPKLSAGYYPSLLKLPNIAKHVKEGKRKAAKIESVLLDSFQPEKNRLSSGHRILLTLSFLNSLSGLFSSDNLKEKDLSFINDWSLDKVIRRNYLKLGVGPAQIADEINLIHILLNVNTDILFDDESLLRAHTEELFSDSHVRSFNKLNLYQGIWYFQKESFDNLINWLFILSILDIFRQNEQIKTPILNKLFKAVERIDLFKNTAEKSGYDLHIFLKML
ncbi:MAG: alpha-amylase family glycosyl hydrolase [Calditrichaceae bacterium]